MARERRSVLHQLFNLCTCAFLVPSSAILFGLLTIIAQLIASFFSEKARNYIVQLTRMVWCRQLLFLFWLTNPIGLKITANSEQTIDKLLFGKGKRSLLISNHQTYIDWCICWFFAFIFGKEQDMRFVSKLGLRSVPFIGQALLLLDPFFLRRDWKKDQHIIRDEITSKKERDSWIMFFPEGTTYTESMVLKAEAFARRNGITPMKHLLSPRFKGLYHLMKTLDNSIDGVYDLTLGFPTQNHKAIESEYSVKNIFLTMIALNNIHIHVRFIPLAKIPTQDEDQFSTWLYNVFGQKDEQMGYFLSENRFKGLQIPICTLYSNGFIFWGVFTFLLFCAVYTLSFFYLRSLIKT